MSNPSRSLPPILAVLASLVLSLACATSEPRVPKMDAEPLRPTAAEQVVVDQLLVIVDSSGSLDDDDLYYRERALVETFLESSPDGQYEAGQVAFGGFDRSEVPLQRFDRERLRSAAASTPYLESGTPLHKVLAESKQSLGAKRGKAAVVIFSDGIVTDEFGRDVENERVIAAARELSESHDGSVCFHTVQVGDSPQGAALLKSLSAVTACGSTRPASSLSSERQLHAMQRKVFLGAAPVAAKKPTLPPVSAPAAASGPSEWSINFGFDSAEVDARYRRQIVEIAEQAQASPKARLRISGHTDTSGNVDYNRALSQRRAEATRKALVEAGVPASRIEITALGEQAPLQPDDSAEASAANRRTEIELVR